LKKHKDEVHTTKSPEITNTDGFIGSSILSSEESKNSKDIRDTELFMCKMCDEKFLSRKNLMKHNKEMHIETLSDCWNFEAGTCDFKENCLFKHEKREIKLNRDQKDHTMFKCKFCDKNFTHRKVLMKHNKEKHTEYLKPCWNLKTGNCNFKENCWFKHKNIE